MQVSIDRDDCIGCALCWETCPEVFEEGTDGLSQVVAKYRIGDDPARGEIPAELESCARAAADGCPVEIIEANE